MKSSEQTTIRELKETEEKKKQETKRKKDLEKLCSDIHSIKLKHPGFKKIKELKLDDRDVNEYLLLIKKINNSIHPQKKVRCLIHVLGSVGAITYTVGVFHFIINSEKIKSSPFGLDSIIIMAYSMGVMGFD